MVLIKNNNKNNIALSPKLKIRDLIKSLILNISNYKKKEWHRLIYNSHLVSENSRSTYSIQKIYEFLNYQYGDKKNIFIPDYICNESLSLLRNTDAKIIFYDHSQINNEAIIKELKIYKADIFIHINYFGKFINLNKNLIKFLKEKNIILIEDNTHCICSPLITYSDIEIYSPYKLYGLENGSIVKFNDINLFNKYKSFEEKYLINYKFDLEGLINLIYFILKKKIKLIIGQRYLQLNFETFQLNQNNFRKKMGPLSSSLLNLYSKRLNKYKTTRIENYNVWRDKLSLVIPFIKMEKLDYIPYLGVLNFSHTKERIKILKSYNSYGLPFGNWPDLPPEILKSRNLYKSAISRFNNHVTVPLHQDIKSFEICNAINKSFDKYINSFDISYSQKSKEIIIYSDNKFIGKIIILKNQITKQNLLCLKFNVNFYNTYLKSKKFFYKFSLEILKKQELNIPIHISKNFMNCNYYHNLICQGIQDNIIPLNTNIEEIKKFLSCYLKIICNDHEMKSSEIQNVKAEKTTISKNKKIFINLNISFSNELISTLKLEKLGDSLTLKKIKISYKKISLTKNLFFLCAYLKKEKFRYLDIKYDSIKKYNYFENN